MPRPHSTMTTEPSTSMSRSSSSARRAQPVRVDVHERRAADERRVRAGDHERRALHGSAHAEARRDPARERRLARAERAGEHDQVAGAQHRRRSARRALHVLGRGDLVRPTSGSSPRSRRPAARHARPDARDDLVVDRAGGIRPVVGRRARRASGRRTARPRRPRRPGGRRRRRRTGPSRCGRRP